MNNRDFIPNNDRSFLTWLRNLLDAVLNRGLAILGIPENDYYQLTYETGDFEQKLNTAETPDTRTKATVQTKNDARKSTEKSVRLFIKRFLNNNPQVSNADRDSFGLPIYKTGRTPAPVATAYPWVQVIINLIRHLRFDFGGSEGSKAKPEGQHGMELVGRIGGDKPASVHELPLSYFDTHTPLTIDFEEEDRGKTFWYAVRWENTTGLKGPWSEIRSAVIP